MSIIVALLVFSFIVFIHELGHFVFARLGGIAVEEFAIGMGPKILGFTHKGTIWSVRFLPIGGFCKMKGEDGQENTDSNLNNEASKQAINDEHKNSVEVNTPSNTLLNEPLNEPSKPIPEGGYFYEQSVWVRIGAVFGGPLFNFILAFVFAVILMSITSISSTEVNYLMEGSPAEASGLQLGDKMISIDGHRLLRPREANIYINVAEGKPLVVVVERTENDGNVQTLTFGITPAYVEIDETLPAEESQNYYYIGVGYKQVETTFLRVIQYAFLETLSWIKIVFYSLGMLFTGQVPYTSLSGPVGLVTEISTGYEASLVEGLKAVVENLSFWVVLISANLGIMNLLPIPALDGGRLSFLLIEALTKKKIAPEKEGFIHFVGFALLMVLMVFVMYNDIARVLGWN